MDARGKGTWKERGERIERGWGGEGERERETERDTREREQYCSS
jgi:hypothetical protein